VPKPPILVLVADDEEVVRELVGVHLTNAGFEVLRVGDGEEALRMARTLRPDVVVLDVEMPDLDGYEVTRRLRKDARTRTIPVLLLTARSEGVDVVRGFEAGGDDYLRKPFSSEELAVRVGALLERRGLIERLLTQSHTDPLTGLSNRRKWGAELPRELARATRYGHPLTLAMLDLDHFKQYNDAYGHPAGDSLLRELGRTWPPHLREVDLIARYGGEEFALLLPNCPSRRALEVVERLRAAMPMGQTFSAGISEWDGHESEQTLVARADAALYTAKACGRDQSIPALPGMHALPVPGAS
jgi:diguanylate cyclase (GGDEF)-like protein